MASIQGSGVQGFGVFARTCFSLQGSFLGICNIRPQPQKVHPEGILENPPEFSCHSMWAMSAEDQRSDALWHRRADAAREGWIPGALFVGFLGGSYYVRTYIEPLSPDAPMSDLEA